ncbi:uncharacterized protein LOC111390240 [Olea europaea var. sylvestris]|uniref:uncharacterized protein LOC111390240 n=1 Tax=Olea europaea var. sylvestris TaxID=158386 RepID=UPI000C1D4CEE|nr:uncharacterized protein LOC111390240 [Olea europaea var. sylvestris]
MCRQEIDNYERLLKEAQKELYPGCKDFSMLTLIVELMQLKVRNLITNKCFDELMGILKRMLPKENQLLPTHQVMRHPANTIVWKKFDKIYPSFVAESRNVRLGLATDGFNPFGDMNKPYSMWLVVVVPNNLPPWMCMKKEFTMLTLLIPGKHEPGKDIDVYLCLLIDDLKELWKIGMHTYDKAIDSTFNLRAAVLWTINDLPAYKNLSG